MQNDNNIKIGRKIKTSYTEWMNIISIQSFLALLSGHFRFVARPKTTVLSNLDTLPKPNRKLLFLKA